MICEKCGKNLPDNLDYCPTCKVNEIRGANNGELIPKEAIASDLKGFEPKPLVNSSASEEMNNNSADKAGPNKSSIGVWLVILTIFAGSAFMYMNPDIGKNFSDSSENSTPTTDSSMDKVPVAKVPIAPGTVITAEMIEVIDVLNSETKDKDAATNSAELIGQYVKGSCTIESGKIFPKSCVTPIKQFVGISIKDIPDGYTVYMLPYQGELKENYIDLYFQDTVDEKTIRCLLVANLELIGEKENNLYFAVENDLFKLMQSSKSIATAKIIYIPAGSSFNDGNEVVSFDYIKNHIEAKVS